MAENYKHLYEQMKKMVEMYQDEIVPELRKLVDSRVEVVRCKDCRHCERMGYTYYCYCHHWSRNTDEDGYCYEGA